MCVLGGLLIFDISAGMKPGSFALHQDQIFSLQYIIPVYIFSNIPNIAIVLGLHNYIGLRSQSLFETR